MRGALLFRSHTPAYDRDDPPQPKKIAYTIHSQTSEQEKLFAKMEEGEEQWKISCSINESKLASENEDEKNVEALS